MVPDGNAPLRAEQREELTAVFGFMKDMCEMTKKAWSELQSRADLAPAGEGRGDVRVGDITRPPVEVGPLPPAPPPPPPFGSMDCGVLREFRDRHSVTVDLDALARLHEFLAALCREIDKAYGGPPEPTR